MSIADLQGKWVLESIAGEAVPDAPEIYFELEGRKVSGFDGCNHFGGPLDDPLQMRMSQRACADEGPRLPLDLSRPIAQLEAAHLEGDLLEIDLPDDDAGKARFRRAGES